MKVRKFKIKINKATTNEEIFEEAKKDFVKAWKAAEKGRVSDSGYDLVLTLPNITWLSKVLSPERVRIIQAIRDTQPESLYQLAKTLTRSLTNVHRDVHELALMGIIELKKTHKKGQKRESVRPIYTWDGFDIAV